MRAVASEKTNKQQNRTEDTGFMSRDVNLQSILRKISKASGRLQIPCRFRKSSVMGTENKISRQATLMFVYSRITHHHASP